MMTFSKKRVLQLFLLGGTTWLYFAAADPWTTARQHAALSHVAFPDSYEPLLEDVGETSEISWQEIHSFKLRSGETFFQILLKMGLDGNDRSQILSAAQDIYDLSSLRPGIEIQSFAFEEDPERIVRVLATFDKTTSLNIQWGEEKGWEASLLKKEVLTKHATFVGTVSTSLWDSAVQAGLSWDVISKFTNVFAWQVDFARELRDGARYRFIIEELSTAEEHLGYGRILAAEFENSGQLYQAIYYENEMQSGYFDLEGRSLKKMFLKSPVKFSRITSRFNKNRFHPVLKTVRPHNGVDYGAAPGTPVYAIGDGVVRFAGWQGAAGKHIQLRHNSTYETGYSHLKSFAKGIRSGARVKQGQVIGYVGATGRVTGPHLHFAFYENGQFVDPLGKKFPAADPLHEDAMGDFSNAAERFIAYLPSWSPDDQM